VVHNGETGAAARAVSVRGLVKEFQSNSTPAVDDVSFDVEDGELLVLLGPSGCGKTTTLRMIAGLEEPDGGDVWLGSRLVSSAERNAFVPTEKRNIGMVFQSYAIWPHMTVFDNVAYPLRVRRVSKAIINDKVARALDLLGLAGLERRSATQLSGGQQQRVALARAIVFEPRILLLDEPLSNLDAKLRVHMRSELKHLQQSTGITSIFVTHDQAESMALADRIIVMNRGRIEQVGTPADIYERPSSPFVSEFVGSINTLRGIVTEVTAEYVTVRHADHDIICQSSATDRIAVGEQVVLSIRPENLTLSTEPSGAVNVWPGLVAASAYYGDHREYEVEISDQRLKVNTTIGVHVPNGGRAYVSCSPAEVLIMRDALPEG
jgi:iron(III) transport system ATP-binding protein